MSGRKETVLDLAKFVDKGVQVKLTGGRQGTLKGYDQLLNLVLDEAVEFLRELPSCISKSSLVNTTPTLVESKLRAMPIVSSSSSTMLAEPLLDCVPVLPKVADTDDPLKTTDQTRRLGLIVCRGTAVMLVSPTDGTEEIANPFIQPDGV